MRRSLTKFVVPAALTLSSVGAQIIGDRPVQLPVAYDEDRFYVTPITKDGTTIRFFTDTGGGLFLFSDVADRFKLRISKGEGDAPAVVSLPEFMPEATIPAPSTKDGRLPIAPSSMRSPMSQDWSGMLGQQWFAGKIWVFDYPHQKLSLISRFPAKAGCAHCVALGFQDKDGERQANFPRIQVSVDGDALDLLLDTGASTKLTDMAQRAIADGRPANRATSFIVASVFDKWHQRHPDWRVIEEAEEKSGMSMIEVPIVSVAGHSIGPVWFTRRADKNFHEFMSQWMDRKVDGAIGGNALRFFRVTIDYPNAVALFERGGNL